MAWWQRKRPVLAAAASSLTAAAKRLTTDKGEPAPPGSAQPWQVEAFDLVEEVPEAGYVTTFIGDAYSRVTLGVGRLNDDGDVEDYNPTTAEARDEVGDAAARLVREFRAPVGGQAQMLRSMGVNLAVGGEFYVVGIPQFDKDAEEVDMAEMIRRFQAGEDPEGEVELVWDILSVLELTSKGRGETLQYVRKTGGKDEVLPLGTIASRVWLPGFRQTAHARSMFKSVLPTMRKLRLVDARFTVEMMSRQNAGLLIVPSEGAWPATADNPDGFIKFVDDLMATMTTPIKDPSSAASIVPNVVQFKGDLIEKWRHLKFDRETPYEVAAQRTSLVEEFARGVQLPVEVTTGSGADNHWSAWLADESLAKAHLEPGLEIGMDGVTATYLRPSLRGLGFDEEQANRWVVTFDTTELTGHPNRGADATEGYDRGTISGPAWRRYKGFTEADAPDDADRAEREAMKPYVTKGGGAAAAPGGAEAVSPGPPSARVDPLAVRLADAADVAIGRAVERVGNQLRNKANGRPGLRDLLAATPPHEVAVTLGATHVSALMDGPLFVGDFGYFARTARRWAAEANHPEPGQVAARALSAAEMLAKLRLYDPDRTPTPTDFAEAVAR